MSATSSEFALAGRTALVTGTSGGIGAACAAALAALGATVIGWERRARADAPHEIVVADLGDPAATQTTAQRLARGRRIDILVNNAGTIDRRPAEQTTLEAWRSVLDVNLDAAFLATRELAIPMLERGEGRIISIASLLSFQGGVNVAAYAASKHALVGMTKALSNEWAPRGVLVNAVAPGYVSTDNTTALREDPARFAAISDRIPLGRWAEPADIAGPVAFLATDAARYVTGHVLAVDGGWLGR